MNGFTSGGGFGGFSTSEKPDVQPQNPTPLPLSAAAQATAAYTSAFNALTPAQQDLHKRDLLQAIGWASAISQPLADALERHLRSAVPA